LVQASKAAADQAFALQKEQFDWAKGVYAENKDMISQVAGDLSGFMKFSLEAAQKDRERYETVFQPLQDEWIQQAQDYASPERIAQEQGRAIAGVSQQFDQARAQAERHLEGYGLNPGATRYGALDIGVRTAEAVAKAGMADAAARQTEATGRDMMAQAIQWGQQLPGQANQTASVGTGAGGAAVDSTLAGTASGANTMGTAPQYAGIGGNALAGWGNMLNTNYANQLKAHEMQQSASSGWGSALGLIGGIGLKAFGFDEGGAVPAAISPSRGAKTDDVPAKLTAGEFVVPQEAVQWYGEKHFVNLIEKAQKEKAEKRGPPPSPIPAMTAARARPAQTALPVG
jgi:hypothetical protein